MWNFRDVCWGRQVRIWETAEGQNKKVFINPLISGKFSLKDYVQKVPAKNNFESYLQK